MPRLYIEPTFASAWLRQLFAGGRPAGDRVCSDSGLRKFSTLLHARLIRVLRPFVPNLADGLIPDEPS